MAVFLLLTIIADLLLVFTDVREMAHWAPGEYFGALAFNNALLVFSFICVRAEVRARVSLGDFRWD
jgi:hypothetical protein